MAELIPLAAYIGIDWADDQHDVSLQAAGSTQVERHRVAQTPEALGAWLATLRARFGAQAIGLAVETSRGPLVHALLEHEQLVLYPVNPRSLHRFRETFAPSGAKADVSDADLLRELLVKHRDRLRPWLPQAPELRALGRFVEDRRTAVDLRTKLTQQLIATLKAYFPQALGWVGEDVSSGLACDFLLQWPTLTAVQRARRPQLRTFYTAHHCRRREVIDQRLREIRDATPLTTDPAILEPSALRVQLLAQQLKTLGTSIARYDAEIAQRFAAQADAALFSALPGSGAALAPRLLVAFGSDRTRYPHAADIQQFSGIAPVTQRSGKTYVVHWRWSVPTFVRQTFHEFANQSIRASHWARAYYALQRSRGKDHHAAVRALAFKWIRIIWRCWQARTPYDDARYTHALVQRGAPLATYLPLSTSA